MLAPSLAAAQETRDEPRCDPDRWRGWDASFSLDNPSGASLDLYNGLFWLSGGAAVHFAVGNPSDTRWSGVNSFDDEGRTAFRASSRSGRTAARRVSDGLLLGLVFSPLLLDGGRTWLRGDCDESFEIAADWVESMGLTFFTTELVKVITARRRPGGDRSDDDSRVSFFSGHASMAAAGAGLTCANSVKRRTWGPTRTGRILPCALGAAGALTAGMMRITGDKHWPTDVLTGWVVGALIGWFDLPGPFDLLRFRIRDDHGGSAAEGVVLPYAQAGRLGAQLSVRF